jgi:rSAM/selenodomain-associated transferase 1
MAKVIVFARAPEYGRVKRRLAAGIGADAALRFHIATLRAVVRRLARWDVVIAVTPDRYAARGRWWPRGVPRIPQGCGDLGERMARALRRYRGEPAVLIGSDIPGVSNAHIAEAIRAARRAKLVFGPAADGGFWLVGARNIDRYHGLFRDVRWSTEHALADTLNNVAPGRDAVLVARLADVDVRPS